MYAVRTAYETAGVL